MARYDRAITVFSPDGHLFQVEYALEAVRKGNAAVGVRGSDTIVLAVEKKSTPKLQDSSFIVFIAVCGKVLPVGVRIVWSNENARDLLLQTGFENMKSVRKIVNLDDHIALACAGLKADARVLINRARIECQSYKLTIEDPVTVEYITRYIAGLQQKYTQSGGVRPFGLSTLIIGFDPHTHTPSLYQTDPSGTFSAWKANATGRNSNSIREFLEKNYTETSGQETLKLAIRALLEDACPVFRSTVIMYQFLNNGYHVSMPWLDMFFQLLISVAVSQFSVMVVESGGKNIEVAVMTREQGLRQLEEAEIDAIVADIEAEKAAAEAAKKAPATKET
ncbi:hypothetical protein SASPL_138285 [Salvia splendens]|uniref:Proteasome alpha-type subunits domain-containing protein n=1 Tax=Salvia splendens TaxID=180675 RepID=A0A8X8ZE85_SALSN|nr:hypothetical protein SASPL_138285 [Salvia splendens]